MAIEPHRHCDVPEQRPTTVFAEPLPRRPKLKYRGVLHTKHRVPTRTSAERRVDVRCQDQFRPDLVIAQKSIERLELGLRHGMRKSDFRIRL